MRQIAEPGIVQDMSWELMDTKVLRVRDGDREVVAKAAGPANHHIGREITAHESFTGPLVERARTGRLIAADRAENVLIIEYQAGELVEGTLHEFDPDVHAQAGSLLHALHNQPGKEGYEAIFVGHLCWFQSRIGARACSSASRALRRTGRSGQASGSTFIVTRRVPA